MNLFSRTSTILLFILLDLTHTAFAQVSLINSLNENLIEVESMQPTNQFANFDIFSKALSNNKLLALGEETHGIKEFMDFRGILIKRLVTELGYKVIVLEADFSGVQTLNNYISGSKVLLSQALLNTRNGLYRNDEFLSIIEWLKAYNIGKPKVEQVKFYGCDMNAPFIVFKLINENNPLNTQMSTAAQSSLKKLASSRPFSNNVTDEEKKMFGELTKELNEELLKFPDTSSYRHSIRTVLQSIELFIEPNHYKNDKLRDRFMAENIEWIYNYESRNKTIIMAHNAHISKNPIYNDVKRMGGYLKETFKEDYYVLGFSFFTGTFSGTNKKTSKFENIEIPEIKNPKSSEYIFSQCRSANFILDFRSAQKNVEIDSFLTQKTYSKNIGAAYMPGDREHMRGYMPLVDKFDGVVFFKSISPLSFIPYSKKF